MTHRRLLLGALMGVACSVLLVEAAEPSAREAAKPAGVGYVLALYDVWPDVHELIPQRNGFIPPYGGTIDKHGWGLLVGYHLRVRRGTPELQLGGDFALLLNGSDKRYAGREAATGDTIHARMYANSGHVSAGAALDWSIARNHYAHVGLGVGWYLLRFKDNIERLGLVETDSHSSALGGYVLAGTDWMPWGTSAGLRLEVSLHAVDFRNLHGGFTGQDVGGPILMIALGPVFR